MISEIEIYSKDSIKLNILQDIIGGKVKLLFRLNNNSLEDYATNIHKDRSRVQVYENFNISEDPSGEILTIRPVVIKNILRITFQSDVSLSNKRVSVVRSGTKIVAQEYEINSNISLLELIPQENQKYILRVLYDDSLIVPDNNCKITHPRRKIFSERNNVSSTLSTISDDSYKMGVSSEVSEFEIQAVDSEEIKDFEHTTLVIDDDSELQRIRKEILVVENKQEQLLHEKQSAINYLEKIESEYVKDYGSMEKELEDIKSRMEADESIIEYYKEQDVTPIEVIFQEIKLKLEEAENQIRFFIEAKQKKTMEIENEIKSNKKQ